MQTANENPVRADRRLFQQLDYHLMADEKPSRAVRALAETPEFDADPFSMLLRLKTTDQSPQHHPEGSVWNHTLLVLDEAASRRCDSADPNVFMWATLLHDIGKPDTTCVRRGKITAYDHDKAGERLTQLFLKPLTDDRAFIDKTAALVRYHMQALFVVKGLPFQDIAGMKRRTSVREVALLALCDWLGRAQVDRQKEEDEIRRFIEIADKE